MEEKLCDNCKNFRPHYARNTRGYYIPLMYGHCVKPRLKKRFGDEKGCSHWEEKTNK